MTSSIEWTDETWNPTLGCRKVSPGCDNCYAIGVAHRGLTPAHRGLTIRAAGERPDWTGEVRMLPDRLDTPLHWTRPRRVFVDSMSDLFERQVEADFIARVFAVMALADRHTFQILTKRPARMATLVGHRSFVTRVDDHRAELRPGCGDFTWPLRNVWLGTSIESDRYAWRADPLRRTPASVRFLSCEPLLGPLPSLHLAGIGWIIAGGESGPGARPMDPEWVRDLRDRCTDVGVPFFFKQWGAWLPFEHDPQPPFFAGQDGDLVDGHHLPADLTENHPTDGWWWPDVESDAIYHRVGKKAAGRQLDGRTWDEVPVLEVAR